jgi:asparagine synthase (glutamine-hydrolysing)
VCVADGLIRTGDSDCPRLDTISYFDDDEPNWNERPYFSLIEKKRGRTGHHIDLTGAAGAFEEPNADFVYPLPGLDAREVSRSVHFGKIAQEGPHRVLLSGVGGDEFLGGVPNHIPEIQDLFVQFRWAEMAQALTHWSFYKRRPWIHLCSQALEEFLPQTIRRTYKDPRIAPWFNPKFAKRYADVFWRDMNRTTLLGVVPSIQSQINTVNHIRRQLSCSHAFPSDGCQVTYPYLDRDLLTFLFAIPRDQLIRAGQRRSLMRRALKGIVPSEILERKRKAFVARRPIVLLQTAEVAVGKLLDRPQVVERGWVELVPLLAALGRVRRGQIDNMVVLLETLKVELWLRTLTNRQLLRTNRRTDHDSILYATSSTS